MFSCSRFFFLFFLLASALSLYAESPPSDYAEAARQVRDDLRNLGKVRAEQTETSLTSSADTNEAARKLREAALRCEGSLSRVLEMQTPQTPVDELNAFRTQLMLVYGIQRKYKEAIDLADFLMRSADEEKARRLADLALRFSQESRHPGQVGITEHSSPDMEKQEQILETIRLRWPDTPLAEEAALLQVSFFIEKNEIKGLGERLRRLFREGKNAEGERLIDDLERYLKRMSANTLRQDPSLPEQWKIAELYGQLAIGLTTEDSEEPGGSVSNRARTFHSEAAKAYKTVLQELDRSERPSVERLLKQMPQQADGNDLFLLKQQTQLRLATALRGAGDYAEAFNTFAVLLQNNETDLFLQQETARTLHCWGESDRKSHGAVLEKAVFGNSAAQPAIWGWNGILRRTGSDLVKYKNDYFEACYAKLHALKRLAAIMTGEKKRRYRELFEKEKQRLHELYPDLGGSTFQPKMEKLFREDTP